MFNLEWTQFKRSGSKGTIPSDRSRPLQGEAKSRSKKTIQKVKNTLSAYHMWIFVIGSPLTSLFEKGNQ